MQIKSKEDKSKDIGNEITVRNRCFDKIDNALTEFELPEKTHSDFILDENYDSQWKTVYQTIVKTRKQFENEDKAISAYVDKLIEKYFEDEFIDANRKIKPIKEILKSGKGDVYYTVKDHVDEIIKATDKIIGRLKTDLDDFESSKKHLVQQCMFQGQKIFE